MTTIYVEPSDPYCAAAIAELESRGESYAVVDVHSDARGRDELARLTEGTMLVPVRSRGQRQRAVHVWSRLRGPARHPPHAVEMWRTPSARVTRRAPLPPSPALGDCQRTHCASARVGTQPRAVLDAAEGQVVGFSCRAAVFWPQHVAVSIKPDLWISLRWE